MHDALALNGYMRFELGSAFAQVQHAPTAYAGQTTTGPGWFYPNTTVDTFFVDVDRYQFELADGSIFTVVNMNSFPLWGVNHFLVTGLGTYDITLVGVIPEPQNYALVLAGLGLLGFAARRRSAA